MKIPEQLYVGGHIVRVEYEKLEDECAHFDSQTLTIRVDPTVPRSLQESSFLHELMHACNSTLGSDHIHHAFMDSLSEQLYQVLSDNGMLAV